MRHQLATGLSQHKQRTLGKVARSNVALNEADRVRSEGGDLEAAGVDVFLKSVRKV